MNRFSLVGIVRNIDPVEKLLFVLTPLGLDDLKQVNTLLKGNLEIPAALLLAVSKREWLWMIFRVATVTTYPLSKSPV